MQHIVRHGGSFLVLLAAAAAQAASITVGTHTLAPNTPNQVIEILLEPGNPVENLLGVDFGAILGDGSADTPSNATGPVFTSLDLVGPGTIFDEENLGVFSRVDEPRIRTASTISPGTNTVAATGVLARLTFDTTGVTGVVGHELTFPLVLDDSLAGTHLSDEFGADPLTVSNGLIRIAPLSPATDPAQVTVNPVNGTTRTAGQTISVSNAAAGSSPRDAATLSNLQLGQGAYGTFSQTGLANGPIAPGASQVGAIAFDGSGVLNGVTASGSLSFQVAGGSTPGGTGLGAYSFNLSATVAGNSGSQSAVVGSGAAYTGLSGQSDKPVGSVAELLGGTHGAAEPTTVQMSWRERNPAETAGTGTSPPLPFFATNLTSDVLSLTGTDGDIYVLQMTYDPGLLHEEEPILAGLGYLQLVAFDPASGLWVNAVSLNHGANVGPANVQGPWTGPLLLLGAWGVDTAANKVWAVLDHNSQFASVPEPLGVGLAALGLASLVSLGVCRRRRFRHNR